MWLSWESGIRFTPLSIIHGEEQHLMMMMGCAVAVFHFDSRYHESASQDK